MQKIWDEIEDRISEVRSSSSDGSGTKKAGFRIPDKAGLEILSGEGVKDQEGFVVWRDRLETHLDTIWPGYAEVYENIRDIKEPVSAEEFEELVIVHGDQPHDHDPEDG